MRINGVNVTERQIETLRAVRDLLHGVWSANAFSTAMRPSDRSQMWLRLVERGWVKPDYMRWSLSESGAAVLAEAEAEAARATQNLACDRCKQRKDRIVSLTCVCQVKCEHPACNSMASNIADLAVEQLVNDGTALNSRAYWKHLDRPPTDDEIRVARPRHPGGPRYFWREGDVVHGESTARPGAQLFRIF